MTEPQDKDWLVDRAARNATWNEAEPTQSPHTGEEVTEADRIAAADWCASQPFPSKQAEAPMIRAGEYDHHSLVQAFAKHRLTTAARQPEAHPFAEGVEYYPLKAYVWRRESTQEWVLEIKGTINDTSFSARHTQPLSIAAEDVPGLPTHYQPEVNELEQIILDHVEDHDAATRAMQLISLCQPSAPAQDAETVERVARAICASAGDNPDLKSRNQETLLARGEGALMWEEWIPEARAAIAALHQGA